MFAAWTVGQPSRAQEKAVFAPTIALSSNGKAILKRLQTIGIFLGGNDPVLSRLGEDALAVQLANVGFTILNRAQFEKAAGEHLARPKTDKVEKTLDTVELARAAKAQALISGTLLMGLGEQRSVLVRAAAFELFDLESESTVIRVFFELEKGRSLVEVARAFAEILREHRK